jgi:solute carrier family 25 uncoupling protein 8/9
VQVKSLYVGEDHVGDVPLSKKIAAGFTTGRLAVAVARLISHHNSVSPLIVIELYIKLTTHHSSSSSSGAIAIAIANPTDLVKVRLQAEGKLAPGMPRRYAGAMDAYAKIARQVCSAPD